MNIGVWEIVVLAVIIFAVLKISRSFGGRRQLICTECGQVGAPRTHTRGSILIEIVLWLCLLVPGLIYSLWRLTTRQQVCRACGGPTLIPMDSPRGRQLLQQYSVAAGNAKTATPV